MLQKNIGDTVTLKVGDKKASYIITGLSQGSSMGGINASLTRGGMNKLIQNFRQQKLQIYLNKGVKADQFVKKLNDQFKDALLMTVDMDKSMEQGMGVYISVVSKIGITILIITILVVILVLYFVINSSVIRIKRELGIQKAIGFTTLQLINQLSLGFLPPITAGVFIGSIIGITQTNAVMSVAQRAMGIMKANFIIMPAWIALFGVAIVIVSYLTSMLITYRIRKISAYALVSD
jgi:putative ABC transport system permease protein